ncbi:uncharacterized protein [Dysidea avara]
MTKPYYQFIIDALQSVERDGSYVSGGIISMPLPALSLTTQRDLILGLPLCNVHIKNIMMKACRAPSANRGQMIVNPSDHCAWQLNPSQFIINNREWEKSLHTLLTRLKTELGCDERITITCELYKLFLYTPGGFCKHLNNPRRTNNMFGSLLIQLPSVYEGGVLTVCHNGKKTKFSFGGSDACGNVYYAAFYADCGHKIQPITKGHCLFLVYNLLYTGVEECPVPPDYSKQVSTIVSSIKAWNEDVNCSDCPEMMSYMLKHPYCQVNRSFSFQVLKNTDSTVADVLIQAKAAVDFNVYVGKVHFTAYYNARSYDDYVDGLFDEDLDAKHLRAQDGDRFSHRVMFSTDSLVPNDFFDSINPDDVKYDEGTEDEEGTLVKWYQWAALLLWPVKRNTAVIGLGKMIDLFRIEVEKNRKNVGLITVAKDIFVELRHAPVMVNCLSFLQALLVFDNEDFIVDCLNIIPAASYYYHCVDDADFPMVVSIIGSKYGWSILKSPLVAIFKRCTSNKVEKYGQFLKNITFKELSDEQKDVCQSLAAVFVDYLINEKDLTPVCNTSHSEDSYEEGVERSKEFVQNLATTLSTLDCDDLLFSFVDIMRNNQDRYPGLGALGPISCKLIFSDYCMREPSAKRRKVGNDTCSSSIDANAP